MVRAWFVQQHDLTLAEVQRKLFVEAGVTLSLSQAWQLLRKLGLRLKNSRFTPPSEIPRFIANSTKNLSPVPGISHRKP
jgi:transposase